jgi:hypothetical protein
MTSSEHVISQLHVDDGSLFRQDYDKTEKMSLLP